MSFECPVCSEQFDNIYKLPLSIPCGHTICRKCLLKQKPLYEGENWLCPICQNTFPPDLNKLSVEENLVPGGYIPPKLESKLLQKFAEQAQTEFADAQATVEETKENYEVIRTEIDKLLNFLAGKREKIDQLMHDNDTVMEAAQQKHDIIENSAEVLITHLAQEKQAPDVLQKAAAGMIPHSFTLTNHEHSDNFNDATHELEHILDEYRFDFELGKMSNKDNTKLYKFVNRFNSRPFVPRRSRRGHRNARQHNQCRQMNLDVQIPFDQLVQQFPGLEGLQEQLMGQQGNLGNLFNFMPEEGKFGEPCGDPNCMGCNPLPPCNDPNCTGCFPPPPCNDPNCTGCMPMPVGPCGDPNCLDCGPLPPPCDDPNCPDCAPVPGQRRGGGRGRRGRGGRGRRRRG